MRLPKNKLKKNKSHLGKKVKAELRIAKVEAKLSTIVAEKEKEEEKMEADEPQQPKLTEEEKFAAKQVRKKENSHRNMYKKRRGTMNTGGKARIV